jgi:photosystem II stability/assembly factor-like uncharacterized protein
VWSSDDAITWAEQRRDNGTPPYTHPTHGAIWIDGQVIAVHQQGGLFTSVDGGATWTRMGPEDGRWSGLLTEHAGYIIGLAQGVWIGTPTNRQVGD